MAKSSVPLAIVTGASSGIGAATAALLIRRDWRVLACGRSESRLEELQRHLGASLFPLRLDVNDPDAATRLVQKTKNLVANENLELSALVNNAGIIQREPFLSTTDATWLSHFATNLFAPVNLTRALIPLLSDDAAIINVASTLGLRPIAQTSAYSASKAAMISWSQCLALELAPKIRVNCVCPGLIDTPIHAFHSETDSSPDRAAAHAAQPMRRMGRPEEIAAMIDFLLRPESAWTTGSVISVDGGISLL